MKINVEDLKNTVCVFKSYYKFVFTYNIILDEKVIGYLVFGGDASEIYRHKVIAKEEKPLTNFLNEEEIKELAEKGEIEHVFWDASICAKLFDKKGKIKGEGDKQ